MSTARPPFEDHSRSSLKPASHRGERRDQWPARGGTGMSKSHGGLLVGLAVASVVLTAMVGVVSNVLVDSWGWALMTALLVLVSCLAIIEALRNRIMTADAGHPEGAGSESSPPASAVPGGITISQSRIRGQVAGRDINQTKIGTGGFAAIAAAVVLLGGGATYLGRTDAAIPGHAVRNNDEAIDPANPNPGQPDTSGTTEPDTAEPGGGTEPSPAVRDSAFLITNGVDLDPKGSSQGIADVSFKSRDQDDGGLLLLGGAELAPIPGSGRPRLAVCRAADGYSTAIVAMPIPPGLSRCLRTSDGRYGTLSITSAQPSALNGNATISWTVW
jgi:hypothetical protein